MASFRNSLAQGKLGESIIARFCISRGNCILPAYPVEIDSGKGPQFFTPYGPFIAPDMFVIPGMVWVEAKHKTAFTWHRITGRWCTGIDLNHYGDYQRVQVTSKRPVWLCFLHSSSTPSQRDIDQGCPPECPTGLFGGPLNYLLRHENHRHAAGGPRGMVYWAVDTLKPLASIGDLDVESIAA